MVNYATGTRLAPPSQGDAQGTRSLAEITSWIDHCDLAQTTVTLSDRAVLRTYMVDESINGARTTKTGCDAVHEAILAANLGPQ
jgi:hypothetical protein